MGDAESPEAIFESFCDHSLLKAEWTHEAHLTVCWVALSTRSADAAIGFLRTAIARYNEATGVANTETSGYHETLTQYYVGAVASLDAHDICDVMSSPRCSRDAPLQHWSRSVLFGTAARAGWVAPDHAPLPWLQG